MSVYNNVENVLGKCHENVNGQHVALLFIGRSINLRNEFPSMKFMNQKNTHPVESLTLNLMYFLNFQTCILFYLLINTFYYKIWYSHTFSGIFMRFFFNFQILKNKKILKGLTVVLMSFQFRRVL